MIADVWSTGQDAVATIKRQLQRLMPGVRIFLDVDDLEDVDALERYVEESAVILMFLSWGYFASRNCLREVVAALEKSKPYLFVHEANSKKGGGPLDDIRGELENKVHRRMLFDNRRVTIWHRITEYAPAGVLTRDRPCCTLCSA